jgi:hypothetical protein
MPDSPSVTLDKPLRMGLARNDLSHTNGIRNQDRYLEGSITSSGMRGQLSSTTARRCETDMRHAKLCTVLHSFAYFSKMGRVSADLTG